MKEGYKLEDTIILNGKVGWVNTGDDADSIIGIQNIQKVKRFSGEEIIVSWICFFKRNGKSMRVA